VILIPGEQGTPAWRKARVGLCTASMFRVACNPPSSQERATYMNQLAWERVTGQEIVKHKTTAMRHGTKYEPVARALYASRYRREVLEGGLVITDDRRLGYSTDGEVIGQNGGIEIKCPSSPTVIAEVLRQGPKEYLHQMQGGMLIMEWDFIDFIMYVPELARAGTELYVQRIVRDETLIADMKVDLEGFNAGVDRAETVFRIPREGHFGPRSIQPTRSLQ
jgi:hypothetical protein